MQNKTQTTPKWNQLELEANRKKQVKTQDKKFLDSRIIFTSVAYFYAGLHKRGVKDHSREQKFESGCRLIKKILIFVEKKRINMFKFFTKIKQLDKLRKLDC